MTHRCPTCPNHVHSSERLMCGLCWRQVPAAIQRELYAAWRVCRMHFLDHASWQLYYKVRRAAIEAVKGSGGGALNAA